MRTTEKEKEKLKKASYERPSGNGYAKGRKEKKRTEKRRTCGTLAVPSKNAFFFFVFLFFHFHFVKFLGFGRGWLHKFVKIEEERVWGKKRVGRKVREKN